MQILFTLRLHIWHEHSFIWQFEFIALINLTQKNQRMGPQFDVFLISHYNCWWQVSLSLYQFSFMMRPLFESFKVMITSTTSDEFSQSVNNWVKEKLSLPKLRIGNAHVWSATEVHCWVHIICFERLSEYAACWHAHCRLIWTTLSGAGKSGAFLWKQVTIS